MTDRDKELDEILSPLREKEPTKLQMKRWKVKLRNKSPYRKFYQLLPLAASLALGFFLGVAATKIEKEVPQKKFISSATKVERFINLE